MAIEDLSDSLMYITHRGACSHAFLGKEKTKNENLNKLTPNFNGYETMKIFKTYETLHQCNLNNAWKRALC